MIFNYGKFKDSEAENGFGCGYDYIVIENNNIENCPYAGHSYEMSPGEAIEFVEQNEDEFFEDDIKDIITSIREVEGKNKNVWRLSKFNARGRSITKIIH